MNTSDDMIADMHEHELKKVFSDGGNKLIQCHMNTSDDMIACSYA